MKKFIYVLIGLVAVVGILLYLDRDIVTYELEENDVVVENGEFRIIGRVSEGSTVEKIEVYHKDGDKLKEAVLVEITEDMLADVDFMRKLRFKEKELTGLKLTTGKENGEDKIYYHFNHKGIDYKHKLLPYPTQTSYFKWNKVNTHEEK